MTNGAHPARGLRPVLIGIGLALVGTGLVSAVIPQPRGAAPPGEVDQRMAKTEYLQSVMDRYKGQEDESYQRYLMRPRKIEHPLPARLDPIANHDESRLQSLQDRAARRAYDGAPPVMPHSKNYALTKTCLDCHAEGMFIGSKFARPMSHAYLTNCEQCHVESRHLYLDFHRRKLPNGFEGLRPPTGGVRASTMAPPVMPHSTMMRVKCLACHGPNGYRGLRTSHPQRLNCVQCHAVAAEADQTSPYFTGIPRLVLPALPAPLISPDTVDPATLRQPEP